MTYKIHEPGIILIIIPSLFAAPQAKNTKPISTQEKG